MLLGTSGVVSGLFAQEQGTRNEQRLHHSADSAVTEIHLSVEHETVACTVHGKGGTSAIAILADVSPQKTEVVARGVIAFDVHGDEIAYSDGSAVYSMRARDGSPQRLAAMKLTEGVVIC